MTQAEFDEFHAARKRVHIGFLLAILLSLAGAVISIFGLQYNPAILMTILIAVVVNLLIQAARFKCPRCKATPMAIAPSFGDGETTIGRYVALSPRNCQKCGMLFAVPGRAGE